jgi:hypothetical protein
MTLRTKEFRMKLHFLIVFCLSTSAFALGDPNFIPATPVDTRNTPPVDAMVDTPNTNEDERQREEAPGKLDHRYDVPATDSTKEDAHERDHSE